MLIADASGWAFALGGWVLAVVGYVFAFLTGDRDRAAAEQRALHAQAHEHAMRRGDRAYDDRVRTYRLVSEWALRRLKIVEMTDPIVTIGEQGPVPDDLPEEHFDSMHVELALFGTAAVEAAFEEFRLAANKFFLSAAGSRRGGRTLAAVEHSE